MPSHVALLIAITFVKNGRLCSYGLAKYKISNETSQIIRWKYFFLTNEQPQLFTSGDLVFISGKYVVENSEQCVTITYASIIDTGNPNHEFDVSDVPICLPHCMFSVTANRKPKEIEEYIHFGVESIEYNSVTGTPDIKMQMIVFYSSRATRFQKYLGTSGSNIKLGNTYFVSGLFKFSTSGQMIIEATDIDYLKTTNLSYNPFENLFSINSGPRSIIDIVADDVESNTAEFSASSVKLNSINASKSSETCASASTEASSPHERKKSRYQPDYVDLDAQDDEKDKQPEFEDDDELDNDVQINEEQEENLQPRKRKRSIRINAKGKKKITEKR
ncbi:1997_t:CDS:1 [Scutellospora calospora]|uniref:1997_t:CDS:1 n=1 Tax=Scutellospora calospora TaxID=85575 RepID=A0ACA9LQ25_9GLOM|nr:1997_t:CDS:1 [Scutellospora calospora]